jgi:hypothetical protein
MAWQSEHGRVGDQKQELSELKHLLKGMVLRPTQAPPNEIIKRIFSESKRFPPS